MQNLNKGNLSFAQQLALKLGPAIIANRAARVRIERMVEKEIWNDCERANKEGIYPAGAIRDRALITQALLQTFERAVAENRLAPSVMHRLLDTLIKSILINQGDQSAVKRFQAAHGSMPPSLLLVSPGKACNLHCAGCYADAGPTKEKLDWAVFDRIISEAKELMGLRFIVISGGEPLAYRSEGHDLLDMARHHPDCFFLFYTNGTLISETVAAEMAEVGNLSPAISVEGFQERTDARRGAGVYQQIMTVMERLKKAGVPYGVSLTATRLNAEELLSEDFIDYIFGEKGALYGWIFQYMPIGRSYTLDLMPTLQQRLWMWRRSWEIIRQRKIFLADFWNHGTASYGCISAGSFKGGGYMAINWNGAVMPCVFLPYSPVNINRIYAGGGTLADAWSAPFFADIRNWQSQYQQGNGHHGNWLAPCIIRDHYQDLQQLLIKHEPDPVDENAHQALLDCDYQNGMAAYGKAYQELTASIWEEQYEH